VHHAVDGGRYSLATPAHFCFRRRQVSLPGRTPSVCRTTSDQSRCMARYSRQCALGNVDDRYKSLSVARARRMKAAAERNRNVVRSSMNENWKLELIGYMENRGDVGYVERKFPVCSVKRVHFSRCQLRTILTTTLFRRNKQFFVKYRWRDFFYKLFRYLESIDHLTNLFT